MVELYNHPLEHLDGQQRHSHVHQIWCRAGSAWFPLLTDVQQLTIYPESLRWHFTWHDFFSARAPHLQCKSNTCVQLDQRLVSWPLFACEFSFKGEFWFEAAIFNAVTQKGLQLSQIGMGPLVGLILTTCTQPCTKEIQFRKLNLKPPALLILFTSSLGPLGSASWSLGKES